MPASASLSIAAIAEHVGGVELPEPVALVPALSAVLETVADPRKRRGIRHRLVVLLTVTLCAVATALEIPVAGGTVDAEGELDVRGTLGVDREAPVGFRAIRLRFEVATDAPQDKLDQLLKLTERYCVVYQTIAKGPPVDIKMQRV